MPFRLLGLALMVGLLYLGWIYRDDLRRLIHRATSDGPASPVVQAPAGPAPSPEAVRRRIDQLRRGAIDSMRLSGPELRTLIEPVIRDRSGGALDSIEVELGDDRLTVASRVETAKLPRSVIGPLGEWLRGTQRVQATGRFGLRRLGNAEWQVDNVRVDGLPLPKAVWQRALSLALPGSDATVVIPLDSWVTGIRITPGGAIFYGAPKGR